MIVEKSNRVWISRRRIWTGITLIVLLLLGSGMYTWYALQRSCQVEAVNEASFLLIGLRNQYDRIYQSVLSTSRDATVRPVAALQQIAMDTQAVTVPACMQTAKDELILYMGTVIDAFRAYGAGESNTAVRALIRQSDMHYGNFRREVDAVNECAPFCLPWAAKK